MDFSFFTRRFFRKNLRKFISQMGNAPGVYERMYGVQKAKSFFLRELLPASELATLHWSYCTSFWFHLDSIHTQTSLLAKPKLGTTPAPLLVIYSFNQYTSFVSRKSINNLMACLERVQWRYQNRERRGRGGQLLFYVLKQVECR